MFALCGVPSGGPSPLGASKKRKVSEEEAAGDDLATAEKERLRLKKLANEGFFLMEKMNMK